MAKIIKKYWPNVLAITFLVTFGLWIWSGLLTAEPLDTYHSSWHEVRAAAVQDAQSFALTYLLSNNVGDFADMGTTNIFTIPSRPSFGRAEGFSPGSKWMFAFCGQHEADDTFSFTMIGWAKENGMLQVICEGNGILGTQDVHIEPNGDTDPNMYWADTIALDETNKWPGSFADGNDGVMLRNHTGANQVALLVVELTGIEYIRFVIYDADGSATECATVGVYGRRY